jgi:hypothetical protein
MCLFELRLPLRARLTSQRRARQNENADDPGGIFHRWFPQPETNDFRDGLNAQGAFYAGEIPSALFADGRSRITCALFPKDIEYVTNENGCANERLRLKST